MKTTLIKLIIATSFTTQLIAAAWAQESDECSSPNRNVDMRSEFCEMRDQDTIGWCYAHSAADLLTLAYHRYIGKKDCSRQVSAFHLAALYIQQDKDNQKRQQQLIELWKQGKSTKRGAADLGGIVDQAIQLGRERGFCYENEISSRDNKYAELHNQYDSVTKFNQDLKAIHMAKAQEQNACTVQSNLESLFPKTEWNLLSDTFEQTTIGTLLKDLNSAVCPNPIKFNTRKLVYYYKNDDGSWDRRANGKDDTTTIHRDVNIMKIIDGQIDNRFPVNLSVPMSLLKGAQGHNTQSGDGQQEVEDHAVTIVGRKMNCSTGQEEYILRNSWGGRCSAYKHITDDLRAEIRRRSGQLVIRADLEKARNWIANEYPAGRAGWVAAQQQGNPDAEMQIGQWDKAYEYYKVIADAGMIETNIVESWEDKLLAHDRISQEVKNNFPTSYLNPDISKCEDGHVFIAKDKLEKYIKGITVLN